VAALSEAAGEVVLALRECAPGDSIKEEDGGQRGTRRESARVDSFRNHRIEVYSQIF
jgi:hypothetical protein